MPLYGSGSGQPLDSDLTAIAALSTTAFGRSVLEAANAAALRTLGDSPSVADLAANLAAHSVVTANNQTGTSYTLALTDAGKCIEVNNGATHTLTVPPNTDIAFPVDTVIEVWRQGAGAVNVAAGSGVTIRSPGGLLGLRVQYSAGSLRKRGTNEWTLTGDLV